MKPGDIISYRDMCNAENAETLQRGMNYRLHPSHSVLLMSTRSNAPYQDEVQEDGKILIYEGHDIPKTADIDDPKKHDQPMYTATGRLTQNGLFFQAAQAFKDGGYEAEAVRVYEKLGPGLWVYNGVFALIDSWQAASNDRSVFKFRLQIMDDVQATAQNSSDTSQPEHTRMIPSSVKVAVWQRDKGCCVKCGSTANLHYDHIIPYSRGGTSLSAQNIQLLCMRCNLAKRDKIE